MIICHGTVLAETLEVLCSPSPTTTASNITVSSDNSNSLSSSPISHHQAALNQPTADSSVTVVPTPMISTPSPSG